MKLGSDQGRLMINRRLMASDRDMDAPKSPI